MSRILVFGADGIIGHYLMAALASEHEVGGTLHGLASAYQQNKLPGNIIAFGVDAGNPARIAEVIDQFHPTGIVNAIGLVKRPRAADPLDSLTANTCFPHLLARLCGARGIRLIHYSTDCVYDGKRGMYRETDPPDNPEWHSRCKALGEPAGEHVLVLRTSFIGLELTCKKSLIEWFLAHKSDVPGYTRAIWSGLTAAELARLTGRIIASEDFPSGTWHLAAATPISKFSLLTALNERLGKRGIHVLPDPSFVCDRSLDGSAFRARFAYQPPSWESMLDELAGEIISSGRLSA